MSADHDIGAQDLLGEHDVAKMKAPAVPTQSTQPPPTAHAGGAAGGQAGHGTNGPPALPAPLPIPPDFPVTWTRAQDASLFWTHDRMHYPDPTPPLEFDFFTRSWEDQGLNVAAQAYDFPIRWQVRHI